MRERATWRSRDGNLAGEHSSWTAILPALVVACIGTGMFNPAVSAVALGSVEMEMCGLAAGVNDTFRQAGVAVGVAALGGGSPPSYVDGLHQAAIAGACSHSLALDAA
ncbi:MAG: hypothetical protein QOG15_2654 [Solirubrobacteraceae bacterium]|jgi:hypothetical protein|nr:hypothetical protein [Solirubrobacteraceae bacterium]